ncbi:MAG: GlsB/YeaQ/YmgE family stress response membrane protein [Pelagimonas sp.]|uniref:GlsB/YeaQ/YmgE family stress response membrane protein n=1 Tax=Pelagimonas sp. TaxID=2073170 RepID=UPI003D6A8EFA
MSIVFLIIIGAAAGFLATRFMKVETGVIQTIGVGIAGALIGGLLLRFLLSVFSAFAGLVGAVLGAMLLLYIWKSYTGR